MAITALDPITALIVIDLQKGIVTMPTAHPCGGGGGARRRHWPTRFDAMACRWCS